MDCLKHKEEIASIIEMFGDDRRTLHDIIERQFTVLMARAQVLLGLCGVVVTVTGFSGRMIAGTNTTAQWLIISGVSLTLASAATVVFGVLPLRWLTQQPGDGVEGWLDQSLHYRDRKLAHYRVGIVLLLVGLVLYVGAMSIMLLNPDADAVPLNR